VQVKHILLFKKFFQKESKEGVKVCYIPCCQFGYVCYAISATYISISLWESSSYQLL